MYVMVPYIFLTLDSQTSLENLQRSQKKNYILWISTKFWLNAVENELYNT